MWQASQNGEKPEPCARKLYGKARYLPYFYSQWLSKRHHWDDGLLVGFAVSAIEQRLFPELRDCHTIILAIDDYGYVYEIAQTQVLPSGA